jgi:hypothetical protein
MGQSGDDQDDEDEFEHTVRGMRALADSGTHGDSDMLLRASRTFDRMREKQASHNTRLALLESRVNDIRADTGPEAIAKIAQTESAVIVEKVKRLENMLYGLGAAIGVELMHAAAEWFAVIGHKGT